MIDWIDPSLSDIEDVADRLASVALQDPAQRPQAMACMTEMGLLGLCEPESCGGMGLGAEALARVLERLARHDAGHAALLFAHSAAQLVWGCAGGVAPEAVPNSGWCAWPGFHDLERHDWPRVQPQQRLSGTLNACLMGQAASEVVTPVRLPDGRLACARFSMDQPGIERGEAPRFMGLRAARIGAMTLHNACAIVSDPLPESTVWALNVQLSLPIMAMQCGLMQGSLETAQRYTQERHQGGGPLLGWGEVRRLLALQLERLSLAHAALSAGLRALVGPQDSLRQAIQLRALLLQTGQLATALSTDGVQLLGGNGYMQDYGQEARMRDAWQLQGLMGPAAQRRQDLLGWQLRAPGPDWSAAA